MATAVMELYELNLATLKEKRVARREYEYDGDQESIGDDIDAQIFADVDTMINEDSAMHYTPIPEEDDAESYPGGYAIYWMPDSAYCETRMYKEVINWDIDDLEE